MPDLPDEEDEERFAVPGDFQENLTAILGVDPEDVEDGEEEPPQE
ncbi:MAG: hypothetical protein ACYDA2_08170 [Acidimicrobiales bacterium]